MGDAEGVEGKEIVKEKEAPLEGVELDKKASTEKVVPEAVHFVDEKEKKRRILWIG